MARGRDAPRLEPATTGDPPADRAARDQRDQQGQQRRGSHDHVHDPEYSRRPPTHSRVRQAGAHQDDHGWRRRPAASRPESRAGDIDGKCSSPEGQW